MEVIPAIDIRGGKCVRLYQGDYRKETVFSEKPLEVASRWVEIGTGRLHVVDLDGAKSGAPVHIDLVGSIASSVEARVQFGGGIRTLEAATKAVSLGVDRVIIGTAALEDSGLVRQACLELGPEAVVVSVDAKDGYVVGQGWTQQSRIPALELVQSLASMGVRRYIYTDIARDGTLTEPNFRAIEELAVKSAMSMLVAGGVSSLTQLLKLSELGIEAAIVGTAVYTGDIDLRDAIDALCGPEEKQTN